jgi:hypothetical protein
MIIVTNITIAEHQWQMPMSLPVYCNLGLQIPKLLVCLTSRLCRPSQCVQCIKLRTLVVPGELLLGRFGEEMCVVVVPASVSNTEAKLRHSHMVETVT